jgi:hypothetical protein
MSTDQDSDELAGLFTRLTKEEELRLWPLATHAGHLLRSLRFVDFRQGQADAALLAARLQVHYTEAELQEMIFVAIPRGGLFVLGWLSYLLDLRPEQLDARNAAEASRLCLVDDCALSGYRLRQQLDRSANRLLVVAVLYATAGMDAAARAYNGRVETLLCAHRLTPQEGPAAAPPGDGRLCAGPAHALAFSWNEPDFLIQTPFDDRPMPQWRLLPPHRCLANRQALALPPSPVTDRQWLVPDQVAYGWSTGTLYLLQTGDALPYRLDGLPADVWRALAGYGRRETALSFLSAHYPDLAPDELARQVDQAITAFHGANLLRSAAA